MSKSSKLPGIEALERKFQRTERRKKLKSIKPKTRASKAKDVEIGSVEVQEPVAENLQFSVLDEDRFREGKLVVKQEVRQMLHELGVLMRIKKEKHSDLAVLLDGSISKFIEVYLYYPAIEENIALEATGIRRCIEENDPKLWLTMHQMINHKAMKKGYKLVTVPARLVKGATYSVFRLEEIKEPVVTRREQLFELMLAMMKEEGQQKMWDAVRGAIEDLGKTIDPDDTQKLIFEVGRQGLYSPLEAKFKEQVLARDEYLRSLKRETEAPNRGEWRKEWRELRDTDWEEKEY